MSLSAAFSKLKQGVKQTANDYVEMRDLGLSMRYGMMESIREDFRAKAKKPETGTLKRAALKTGIALSYIMG